MFRHIWLNFNESARNKLTGSIPTEFGNLNFLMDLWLEENELTGSIPTEFGNVKRLQEVSIGKLCFHETSYYNFFLL